MHTYRTPSARAHHPHQRRPSCAEGCAESPHLRESTDPPGSLVGVAWRARQMLNIFQGAVLAVQLVNAVVQQ